MVQDFAKEEKDILEEIKRRSPYEQIMNSYQSYQYRIYQCQILGQHVHVPQYNTIEREINRLKENYDGERK